MMREFESESVALRRIRSHRHRRAAWRHMIRVRRRRVRLCGVFFLLMDLLFYITIHEVSLLFLIMGVVALMTPDILTTW